MADLIEKDLVFKVVGCAMRVHGTLGRGLREKSYERALHVEFRHEGIQFSTQSAYPVLYRGEQVDEYVPDLVVEGRIIVEIKSIGSIADLERAQALNYLRVTGLKVGLILNFRNGSLEWERVVLDSSR